MVSIQERFAIKSGLWWRTYAIQIDWIKINCANPVWRIVVPFWCGLLKTCLDEAISIRLFRNLIKIIELHRTKTTMGWSPCDSNSRVVRWVTWLNSKDFLYKMITFDWKWEGKREKMVIGDMFFTLNNANDLKIQKSCSFFWEKVIISNQLSHVTHLRIQEFKGHGDHLWAQLLSRLGWTKLCSNACNLSL